MNAVENHLIELLPAADRNRILALCEPVELVLSEVLCEPGKLTHHVYFPTQGYISLVALADGSSGVEVGMVGREGMLGAQLVLGVATVPLHALVQGPGTALRMPPLPSSANWRAARPCGVACTATCMCSWPSMQAPRPACVFT